MNRVKALTADAAVYPLWIAFMILVLIWRIRIRLEPSSPTSEIDGWLDDADHDHQCRATSGAGGAA